MPDETPSPQPASVPQTAPQSVHAGPTINIGDEFGTAKRNPLTFTLRNSGEKSLWVHGIQGKLVTSSGEQSSDAVSAVDFDRYYQAFPALKADAQPALAPEDKLQPGQEVKRTVMVSFPVTLDAFNQRRSVSVIIQPYDQPLPVVLTK